jgi:2-polyprenyl-3-methyl-5-hydroxy-6-metoxy-1,4-benzoquinol methylase
MSDKVRKSMNRKLYSGERQVSDNINSIEKMHKWRYEQTYKYIKNKHVIDLGCGCGYGSYMMSNTAAFVFGIDDSDESIEYAKEKWRNTNIGYWCGDILDLSHVKYEVIVAFEIIEHVSDEKLIWDKLKEITSDILILSVPHESIPVEVSKWHFKHYNKEEVSKNLIDRGFRILKMKEPKFYHGGAIFCVAKKEL